MLDVISDIGQSLCLPIRRVGRLVYQLTNPQRAGYRKVLKTTIPGFVRNSLESLRGRGNQADSSNAAAL